MKRLLSCLAVTLIAAISINAQQKAGTFAITPKAGFTVSKFSGDLPAFFTYYVGTTNLPEDYTYMQFVEAADKIQMGTISFGNNKSKINLTFGVEGQYQFNKVLGLSLGVFYAQGGVRYKTKGTSFTNGDVKISIKNDITMHYDCITLPLIANVYVWKGLSLKAGIQPEFAVDTKVKGDVTMEYKGETKRTSSLGDAPLKSFSLTLPVGLGYEYKNIVADLRYGFGLTKLNKEDRYVKNYTARNRACFFTLGYKFQL